MSQFGSGFRPPAAPVEEGKVYEAKIEDMGREGDGLCRVANFVVFIPGTKVGDQVKFKVTKVLRRVELRDDLERPPQIVGHLRVRVVMPGP